ncbi:MAG TPA: HIT family protein [Caulobacteraceae bacterium]|nr:HIT family protein [Caulobacteraceae bacterium]
MSDFILSPAFVATSVPLASLALSEARLQADARWPWIVLIPRFAGAQEVEDLPAADRARLMEEVVAAGRAVRAVAEALGRPVRKLNLGLLGNITPQLHAHVVGRRPDDPTWPGPVWGYGEAVAYRMETLELARETALSALRA